MVLAIVAIGLARADAKVADAPPWLPPAVGAPPAPTGPAVPFTATAAAPAAIAPQPQDANDGFVVQTTDPHLPGVTYAGSPYTVPAAGDTHGSVFVGYNGPGVMNLPSGTLNIAGNMSLGFTSSGQGTFNLSGTGNLKSSEVEVGQVGIGIFNQTGGTLTGTGEFPVRIANGAATAHGTYNLQGGTLSAANIVVGSNGNGTLNLNGGTLQATVNSTDYITQAAAGGTATINVQTGGTTGSAQGGAIIDTNGFNLTINLPLQHDTTPGAAALDGGLTKIGAGILTLSAANTYTGPTSVSVGTLAVNGALTGGGMLTVASGGTLAGSGSVAGAVTVNAGGRLAPGTGGTGRLTLGGSLTLAGTSTASFTLGGTTAGTGYTQLAVGTTLALGGSTLSVSVANGFTLALNQTFFLIDRTGTDLGQIGTFGNAPNSIYTDAAGDTFRVNYLAVDPANGDLLPNDLSLTVLSVVPEPSTWALVGVGAAGLCLVTLRQRRHARLA